MEKKELAKELSDKIINETDVKYIAHYGFENLEGVVASEIEKHLTDELNPRELEDILDNVYRYVLEELAKEIFNFIRYGIPQYKNTFYNKLISKNATTKI